MSKRTDATTLAHWCNRSSDGYNLGAWQTALVLQTVEFRRWVAEELVALGADPEGAAMRQWGCELATAEVTA